MEVVQSSFFDIGTYDEANAYAYRRREKKKEVDAWLLNMVGPHKFKQIKDDDARLTARMNASLAHVLSPEMQASLDKVLARIRAETKPFLSVERALLGVAPEATKGEVKNAFRRKARKLHPDVGGDENAMKVLNAAYKKVLAAAKA